MSNDRRRPSPRNPMIWRKATAAEIATATERAKIEHTHHYYAHATLNTHMRCACGWICKRDWVPADLIFAGPVR